MKNEFFTKSLKTLALTLYLVLLFNMSIVCCTTFCTLQIYNNFCTYILYIYTALLFLTLVSKQT